MAPNRLKQLTWLIILLITACIWTSIFSALRADGSAPGAPDAPGQSQVGKSESLNPGACFRSPFFFKHNVYFPNQEDQKLNTQTEYNSVHSRTYGNQQNKLHVGEITSCDTLHNTIYITLSVISPPNQELSTKLSTYPHFSIWELVLNWDEFQKQEYQLRTVSFVRAHSSNNNVKYLLARLFKGHLYGV